MVDVTPDNSADEVEQLADALTDQKSARKRSWHGSYYYPVTTRDELRALARAAATVGARTALEDAAFVFATSEGVEATAFAKDNVEAVRATETWLYDRAETYTTDEETTA